VRKCTALAVLLALPGVADGAEVSVQEALLRAKPAVALVMSEVASEVVLTCPSGGAQRVAPTPSRETGTGWFISPSGWMITNAHVVATMQQPQQWIADQQAERAARQACGDDLGRQALAAIVARAKIKLEPSLYVLLSNGVRLPATVAKYNPPAAATMSGRDLALLKLEAADMPTLVLGDSANAKLGDKLHILGFPGVVLSHELLNASNKVEASVTNGAISGFKQDITNQPVIQTDAPAAGGNSGGPAVGMQGEVLGVLTFVTTEAGGRGEIVQGFNFVIPSSAVRDFIKGTEVPLDERSRFNAAWHAGLADYFAGNYSRAEKSFTEANRLLPELPDVRRLMAEAKNPPPRPFPWATIAVVVTVVSFGAAGGVLATRWKRNRYRIRPSEVLRLIETSLEKPIILDVRDTATYVKSPVKIPESRHVAPDELEAGKLREIERDRTVVAYCT
jgi:S1-C subfamily serine protease